MANTYVDYTAVASQTDYNFSFEYLRDAHVKVKVNGTLVTNYTIVTSPTPTKIRFNTAPAAGAAIKIYRDSRGDFSPLVDFVNGSILTENELDESYKHNLFVSQEASEGQGGEQLTKKGLTHYDAEGNKIINLGTPTDSTDAANKAYTDQTIDNAIALGGSPAIVSLGGYDVTALGSTRARSLANRFADVINVLDYYEDTGNDTTAIQNAASAATAASKPLYAPAGTYIMTTGVTVTHGLIGDGPNDTIFQGVDDGTVKGSLITTTSSGTGLYAGFTLDGACSADPAAWDLSNYDSFTGHQSVFNCGGNKIVISNVVSQNSFFAPFRCENGNNVLFENCKAIRGRGNFGDGYYIKSSHNVTLINCIAEDVTRIGFVCEGDDTRICENVTFIGCHAENAHDQSSNFKTPAEFNAGFWFENSTLNTCIGCTAKDTDDGFVYAGTDNVSIAGHSVAKGAFINCYAETVGYGFYGQTLTVSNIESILTYDNCSVKDSDEAFVLRKTTATLNSCSFTKDGGGDQTRSIHALEDASLFINGFYENWTNKPASDLDITKYAGSISAFSDAGPAKEIVIDGYRTYNDAYFTIKFVNSEHQGVLDLTVKNAVIRCPIVNAKSVRLDNCIVEDSFFNFTSDLDATNSTFTGSLDTHLYTTDSFVTISNSKFERTDESKYLSFYNQGNSTNKLKYFINNCSFVGNVETGRELINVNTDTALASTSRCADIAVNGCTFYNSGGSTTNPAIKLERIITVSDVYATSVWKSSSLTNLATTLATGSTVVDR